MIWDFMKYENNTALDEGERTYTYAELHAAGETITDGMKAHSLVFQLTRNTAGSVAGYTAFLNHGIVPLMIDEGIDRDLLHTLLEEYRPSYLWLPDDLTAEFADYEQVKCLLGYTLLDTGEQEPFKLHDDLALLITTSGSTGSPKLVRQSGHNILSNAQAIVEYLRITESERAVTSLPMNYVYGLSVINTHLYAGACLVLTGDNCYSGKFWDMVDEKKVTSFAGVPFMYEMLHKLRITKREMPSIKTMTQAGGKLSADLQEFYCSWAKECGKKFIIMYGASEATSRMGYLPFEYALTKRGSIGIPIPGGSYELLDENDQPITECGVSGELCYRGDNVTLGYAQCGADLAKGDENGGRLLTGDMACRDEDGFYYITGRKKRFLKILGKRTSLDEIEALLKKHFDTLDIACAGADDDLRIFTVDASLKEEILSFIMEKAGINRGLCRVGIIDEIPKNNSGKILYGRLNEMEV